MEARLPDRRLRFTLSVGGLDGADSVHSLTRQIASSVSELAAVKAVREKKTPTSSHCAAELTEVVHTLGRATSFDGGVNDGHQQKTLIVKASPRTSLLLQVRSHRRTHN